MGQSCLIYAVTLNKYNYDKSDELHIIMLCNMTFLGA